MLRMLTLVCLLCVSLASQCEAQSAMRQWSDKTGKFKIQAKFVSLKEGVVTLSKFDGKKLQIPIEKLSEADRLFVEGLSGNPANDPNNPFKESLPDPPSAVASNKTPEITWKPWDSIDLVKLRKLPDYSDKSSWDLIPQSSNIELTSRIEFQSLATHERVSGMAASPNGLWVAISIHDPRGSARMHLFNLREGTCVASVDFPDPPNVQTKLPMILAVSNDGKNALTGYDSTDGDSLYREMTLWSVVGQEFVKQRTWMPFVKHNEHVTWAIFLEEQQQLVLAVEGDLVFLDLTTGKPLYQVILDAGHFKITSDSRYILTASRTKVMMIDVRAARIHCYREVNANAGIDISPDGKRLACDSGSEIEILDSVSGDSLKKIRKETRVGGFIWAGNNHILLNNQSLFDVEREFFCWDYIIQREAYHIAGKVWFLVSDEQKAVLRSGPIPDSTTLAKLEESLRSPEFFICKPGAKVNVDVQLPVDRDRIRASLILQIEAAGYVYDSTSSLSLVATKRAGKTDEVNINERQSGTFGFGFPGSTVKKSFTPQIVQLALMDSGVTYWQRSSSGYLPPVIDKKEGEDLDSALKRYEDPGLKLFEEVKFPKYIVRPSNVGRTIITMAE